MSKSLTTLQCKLAGITFAILTVVFLFVGAYFVSQEHIDWFTLVIVFVLVLIDLVCAIIFLATATVRRR